MSKAVLVIAAIACTIQNCIMVSAKDKTENQTLADLSRIFSEHLENKKYRLAERDQRKYLSALKAENAADQTVSRAQITLAKLLTQERKFAEAEKVWNAALDINKPQRRFILKQKADVFESVGRIKESENILISLCATEQIESPPRYKADLFDLGNLYLRGCDYVHAEQTYRTLISEIEQAPGLPTVGAAGPVTAYLMLAITLKDSGKLHEAVLFFSKALALTISMPKEQAQALSDQCFNGLSFIYKRRDCSDKAEIEKLFRNNNRKLSD